MKLSTFLLCYSAALSFTSTFTTAALCPLSNLIANCTKPGLAALTIDDGSGFYTETMLELLKDKNVSATFFLWGQQILANDTRIKRITNEGHQVALHGYNRTSLDAMPSIDAIEQDLNQTSELIFRHSGLRPNYVRAPYDQCKTDNCLHAIAHLGLKLIHFTLDSLDWKFAYRHKDPNTHLLLSEEESTRQSMNHVNDTLLSHTADPALDSIILLMHETHPFSVLHLAPKLIDLIRARGYTFVSLEECLKIPTYKLCHYKREYDHDHDRDDPKKSNNQNPSSTTITTAVSPTGTRDNKGTQAHKVATWTLALAAILAYMLA
ncbi:unnamed protein product [Mortierella alpina]